MRRKLDRIQHDNRDTMRRRDALDHMFIHDHLNKRYQWYAADKSYRDSCRAMWSRQSMNSSRNSHIFLPNIYSPELSSALSMASIDSIRDESSVLVDEKIKQDFLQVQPVMLEISCAPHSSEVLRKKQNVAERKQSAEQRQNIIQTTARSDSRFLELVNSLQEFS